MLFKTLSLSLKLEDAGRDLWCGERGTTVAKKNGLDLPGSEDRHFLCTCDIDMLFFGIYSLGSCEYYGVSVASGSSHRNQRDWWGFCALNMGFLPDGRPFFRGKTYTYIYR